MGLITPSLYSIFNNPQEYSKAFHDVTSGNNNPDSAGVGWDPLTGLGSPNFGEIASLLAPTGTLQVSVNEFPELQTRFQLRLRLSGARSSRMLRARQASSSTGTVSANITGPAGQHIATNIPLVL